MFSRLRAFWKALKGRSRMEVEMDAELRFHMEAYTEDLVRSGAARAEAERRARREFGGVESTKEDCRQALGLRLVDELRQDVRYAARSLRRSPGFTAVAVITLAVGISATTAIFSFVDAVFFKPLAYREADRLVIVRDQIPPGGDTDPPVPVYLEWKGQNQVFSSMASVQYGNRDVNLTGGPNGFALRARALSVSAGFFELVGVPPVLGRSFLPGEDQPGAESVMVISNRLWRNTFSSDPEIAGKSIRVNGLPCTIAGVLPPGVFDRGATDVWMPWVFAPREISSYQPLGSCNVLARLKPGVTLEQAGAEMQRVAEAVNREHPEPSRKGYTARVVPLRDSLAGTEFRRMLLLFQGAVFLLLMIACVNVANLTMARAASRQREAAMRLSLGATRWRLIRQSLTESALIAVSGTACGMLFTVCLLRIAGAVLPRVLPDEAQAGMDWRAPLFALATCLATALLFGLAPALRLSSSRSSPAERFSLSAALKATHGWRGGLVVTEIALTFVLVAVGGLLAGALLRLLAVDTGIRPRNLLTFSTVLPERRYPDAPSILRYQQQLLERLRLLPAVRGASIAETLPLGGSQSMTIFRKDGPASRAFSTTFNLVTPGYFATVGARLQKGRWFSEADSTGQNPVVVVSETFARRFFAAEDPLGKIIYPVRSTSPHTIIGVVADVRLMDLRTPGSHQMYLLYGQAPEGFVTSVHMRRLYFLVRTASAPLALAPAIQRLAAEVDAEQPAFQFRSMEDVILESVPRERLRAVLLAAFAATALMLATAGVYGILHYSVVQRTREIGIRMALGAQVRDVVGMILRQGMTLVLPGVAIGLAAALMLTRLLQSMLFEVKPRDPATFAVVTLVVIVASCFACYLPARRAAKTDPLKCLRYE